MSILGNILLALAGAAALFGAVAFISGARSRRDQLTRQARQATFVSAGIMTLAVALLLIALLAHDFSLKYVYDESALGTQFMYLISALWAGNPGSLLFWGWLVALAGSALLWRGKVHKNIMPYAMSVVLVTEIFFLALIFLQNPFTRMSPVPTDGQGMNPLLQNLGMVFHPPLLLAGWALMLVPFAIAIGALITRRLNNDWLVSARRWALAAWLLLGIGNLLGAWWAYYELGWGGYWAWDPVENAGLMPWLLVTAFLHSTMLQRRRGFNKMWNLLLIIFAFVLTIFGAYLTRSDILNSVHTFGQTPSEPVFVVFMALALVGAIWLVISRRKDLPDEPSDDALVSGETTFFVNNLLLITATAAIFIGTMYPFLSRVFTGSQIEPDAHFFDTVAIPVFLAIILLAGLCVLVGFRKPDPARLGRSLIWPAAGALVLVVALFIFGIHVWYALGAAFILAFAFLATIVKWISDVNRARPGKRESWLKTDWRLFRANRPRYGGYIIHLAIVIIAAGVLGSSVFDVRVDEAVLAPGQTLDIQAYTLVYNGYTTSSSTTLMKVIADFDLKRGDKVIGKLNPSLDYYANRTDPIAESAVRSTLADDVYISIYGADMSQNVALQALVNPLVDWMWIGGIILLLGGLWAFSAPTKAVPEE